MCLATFEIVPVGRQELERADAMAGSDLEDNVAGLRRGRGPGCYRHPRSEGLRRFTPVPVLSPAELLAPLPKDDQEETPGT